MKQSCFDKKVPHSYMASGKFLVCVNCGKKRGPKKLRINYAHNPPDWAAWELPESLEVTTVEPVERE